MKRPTFPSVNIGNPVERSGFAVFPIFVAQLNLFDIHDPKPPYAVADAKQRRKVLACNRKLDGLTLPSLTNSKAIPLLALAGDEITDTSYLTCAILVPGNRTIRVPALCYGPAREHAARGGPVFPPRSAIGWVAASIYEYEFHLFGNEQICRNAGWQRRQTVCSSLGVTPKRQDVQTFVNLVHSLDFQRVKSVSPLCTEWIALDRRTAVQASALFCRKQLIHLLSIKTL